MKNLNLGLIFKCYKKFTDGRFQFFNLPKIIYLIFNKLLD